ncbi:MAG: RidA family protein [Bdellovibrionales bacterium]|nr:RidA family protein [Bdellovibrionales bacterium]
MKKEAILTKDAPAPIGPYSQAIRAGNLLFCSGQIPFDPATGQMVGQGDVKIQTRRVMDNIAAILKTAGASFDHIAKTTIFLKSMNDFPMVNEIYGSYFSGVTPARSTVEVARLPKDVSVEIEVTAVLG